ncbi:hypothetical protein [Vibrio crassostreae]|uniref:hypothetical protein n=1 Tax=Vibrio crassostreae TaxID=246167 RepID=UPI001B305537|nr:hypothetical protein [Vibrio crassostreae]
MKVFDQVEELLKIDQKLQVVEWEVIGGETTMMPFDWWEEMLPYALERIDHINRTYTTSKGGLNFLTNLIYKDKRYTELFKKYKNHPLFCLYTSWEPDTQRFGHNDKLLPRFHKTLREIGSKRVTLDLILTKTLVEMEPEDIIKEYAPLGVNDYSIKMLSPFGSGKKFFKENMTPFSRMSDFVEKFDAAAKKHGVKKFTPKDEMLGSLNASEAFQCNGGFKYDLSIEPDGFTHFNANQTGDESATASVSLSVEDPDWAMKTLFENKVEEAKRFHSNDIRCYQCPYYRHCAGGWFHYRSVDFQSVSKFAKDECQGLKRIWDLASSDLKKSFDHSIEQHLNLIANPPPSQLLNWTLSELDITDYEQFLHELKKMPHVNMTEGDVMHKNAFERCLAYDDLGLTFSIDKIPSGKVGGLIVYHTLNGNLKGSRISPELTLSFIKTNTHNIMMNVVAQVYDWIIDECKEGQKIHALPMVQITKGDVNAEVAKKLLELYFDTNEISLKSTPLIELQRQINTEKLLLTF